MEEYSNEKGDWRGEEIKCWWALESGFSALGIAARQGAVQAER